MVVSLAAGRSDIFMCPPPQSRIWHEPQLSPLAQRTTYIADDHLCQWYSLQYCNICCDGLFSRWRHIMNICVGLLEQKPLAFKQKQRTT